MELRTSTLGAQLALEAHAQPDASPSLAFTADSKLQQDFAGRRASMDSEELPNPVLAQRIRDIIDDDDEEETDLLTEKNSVQTNKFKNTLDHINEELQKMNEHGLAAPLLSPGERSEQPGQASLPEARFRLIAAIEEEPQAEDEEFRSAREGDEEQELFTVLEGPPPADRRSEAEEADLRSALEFHTAYNLSRTDE